MTASNRKNKQRGKIQAGSLAVGTIDPGGPPDDPNVSFSFKYLRHPPPFSCVIPEGYFLVLFERLRVLSRLRMGDFLTAYNKRLMNHAVPWEKTTQPDGFTHLPEPYQAYNGFQFSVNDRDDMGRVFGFVRMGVFYICWLDPEHKVYG